MKQVIVILLKKDKKIEQIRKRYVQEYKKFKPHITLVYPFRVKNQIALHGHIKNSIENVEPFELSLEGLKKSAKGYYLYLIVNKGGKEVIKLYNNLNKRLLKDFKNKDMPEYIPHLSIGVFKTKKEIDEAIKEIKKDNISLKMNIKSIHLLTINKNHALISKKDFRL
jgi:2'-5' RNA ligase